MLSISDRWMIAGGVFVVALLLFVWYSPVVMKGRFVRRGSDDRLDVTLKLLYGVVRWRVTIPVFSFTGQSLQTERTVSASGAGINSRRQAEDDIDAERVARWLQWIGTALRLTKDLTGWLRMYLSKVKLLEWKWSTTLGTGDAMWTAMATGAAWSLKTTVAGLLSQFVRLQGQPYMQVSPNFSQAAFCTEWSCIAQIRFGYAILAGLHLLVRMKKWKGGRAAWRNILFRA